eukprot:7382470-Prymnesium_polylepis.1
MLLLLLPAAAAAAASAATTACSTAPPTAPAPPPLSARAASSWCAASVCQRKAVPSPKGHRVSPPGRRDHRGQLTGEERREVRARFGTVPRPPLAHVRRNVRAGLVPLGDAVRHRIENAGLLDQIAATRLQVGEQAARVLSKELQLVGREHASQRAEASRSKSLLRTAPLARPLARALETAVDLAGVQHERFGERGEQVGRLAPPSRVRRPNQCVAPLVAIECWFRANKCLEHAPAEADR